RPMLDNVARRGKKDSNAQVQAGTSKNGEIYMGYSVRTERWRYTEWDEGRKGAELYDHQNDPREFRNLAKDPDHAKVVEEMRQLLREGIRAGRPQGAGAGAAPSGPAREGGWTDLTRLDAWREPTDGWTVAGDAGLQPDNPKLLASKPGSGVLVNGPKGRARNLLSKEALGDVEVHVEFMV